jgi:Holliday junction resolvase
MAVNSCQKGKRGEREAVKYLKSLGFADAVRTQQYNGLGDSDVICPESLPGVHIEVKFGGGRMDLGLSGLHKAVTQARRDSDGGSWVVLWKPMRQQWRLTWDAMGVVATVCGDEDIRTVLSMFV